MIAADRVVDVQRGTWKSEDARDLVHDTRVVGRAKVQLELAEGRMFVVDALVVASQRIRNLGQRFAVFFHPEDGRLVALPMEARS